MEKTKGFSKRNEEELRKVETYLDKGYILFGYYDGYGLDYGEHFAQVESYVRCGDIYPFYELFDDYINEVMAERVNELINDIRLNMEANGDLDLFGKYEDYIREEIWNRDESDGIWSILDRRKEYVFFYELGLEVPDLYDVDKDGRRDIIGKMAAKVGLQKGDARAYRFFEALWANSGYGGSFRLYFKASIEDLEDRNIKSMVLDGYTYLGIVDSVRGAGYVDDFKFHKVRLPFNRKHLYVSEAESYSWEEIAGLVPSWAERIEFSTEPAPVPGQERQRTLQLFVKEKEHEGVPV